MLQAARTVAPPVGAPMRWCEGSVLALPFPEATFDVVCAFNHNVAKEARIWLKTEKARIWLKNHARVDPSVSTV
jgi:ubiquinone/menaquinone biosynthesis C-methylase UbiE